MFLTVWEHDHCCFFITSGMWKDPQDVLHRLLYTTSETLLPNTTSLRQPQPCGTRLHPASYSAPPCSSPNSWTSACGCHNVSRTACTCLVWNGCHNQIYSICSADPKKTKCKLKCFNLKLRFSNGGSVACYSSPREGRVGKEIHQS